MLLLGVARFFYQRLYNFAVIIDGQAYAWAFSVLNRFLVLILANLNRSG